MLNVHHKFLLFFFLSGFKVTRHCFSIFCSFTAFSTSWVIVGELVSLMKNDFISLVPEKYFLPPSHCLALNHVFRFISTHIESVVKVFWDQFSLKNFYLSFWNSIRVVGLGTFWCLTTHCDDLQWVREIINRKTRSFIEKDFNRHQHKELKTNERARALLREKKNQQNAEAKIKNLKIWIFFSRLFSARGDSICILTVFVI